MMELEALQTVLPQIRALGASLVAISPQRSSYGRAVRRRASLEFDVLSDEGLKVAQAFGLAFTLPPYLTGALPLIRQHAGYISRGTGVPPSVACQVRCRPAGADSRRRR